MKFTIAYIEVDEATLSQFVLQWCSLEFLLCLFILIRLQLW